jgi:hypothetical protein
VERVTVHHLTRPAHLPLIEVEGLRTRADLSGRFGPPDAEDDAAPGRYAHGRRVSAYLRAEHARGQVAEHGGGHVTFTVDVAKALGVPGSARTGDPEAYWAAGRPLEEWLAAGDPPDDLEVHQPVPVRAKHLEIRAALLGEDELNDYAPIVAAVADDDRLVAKALMHLAIIASAGDFGSPAFNAAVALAWRDEPDRDDLTDELHQIGVDKVASAALAELGATAPDAVQRLREVLDETREWGEQQGADDAEAVLVRSTMVLQEFGFEEA